LSQWVAKNYQGRIAVDQLGQFYALYDLTSKTLPMTPSGKNTIKAIVDANRDVLRWQNRNLKLGFELDHIMVDSAIFAQPESKPAKVWQMCRRVSN
jgi:hypothetical protein